MASGVGRFTGFSGKGCGELGVVKDVFWGVREKFREDAVTRAIIY
jgi:hypothetical protein